jgi:hypothetical protein
MGAQQSFRMRRNALKDDLVSPQEAIETILTIIDDEPQDAADKGKL